MIVGPTGPKSKLSNGRTVINLASYNYYNFVANDSLKEKAINTLRTYGVGPCGPPGFYGTQDVHMRTEADVAAHLGVPACIVYAQAFSTIPSVIPAFSKRGDIIVADKACNFAIRKGIQISRSTVRWYEHNDLEDMERVLAKVVKEAARKPLTRRFIVTEGLFEEVGDMADLVKIVSPPCLFPPYLLCVCVFECKVLLGKLRYMWKRGKCSAYHESKGKRPKLTLAIARRSRLSSNTATNSASSSTRPGPTASSAAPAVA